MSVIMGIRLRLAMWLAMEIVYFKLGMSACTGLGRIVELINVKKYAEMELLSVNMLVMMAILILEMDAALNVL